MILHDEKKLQCKKVSCGDRMICFFYIVCRQGMFGLHSGTNMPRQKPIKKVQ